MKRYDQEICNCAIGPHIESKEDEMGGWVRFEDADAEIQRLRRALEAIKNAPGGGPGKRIETQALGA